MPLEESRRPGPISFAQRTWLGIPFWALAIVALAGIIPSLGTLATGLISEDSAALGYVHRNGPFSDWFGPEYDLRQIRFWRPLVTTTLGLQEAVTGTAVVPLRLFNLACHLLMAVSAIGVARKLHVPSLGAVLVGLCIALFPHQGGTVTWVVGRTEAQSAPLILLAIYMALSRRVWIAALFCFLAMATKESGFVAAPAILVLAAAEWLGRDEKPTESLVRTLVSLWPVFLTFALTVVWRRLALGTWAGGYPGGLWGALPKGPDGETIFGLGQMLEMLFAATSSMGLLAWLIGVSLVLLLFQGFAHGWRDEQKRGAWLLGGGVLCCLGSVALLATFFAKGQMPPEHQRLMLMADVMLMLGASSIFVVFQKSTSLLRHLPLALFAVLVGLRGKEAWTDTHDWARAGNLAAGIVAEISGNLAQTPDSARPVLSYFPPGAVDGAYVLQWGVADYFRPPFALSPRPVWPWRPSGFGAGLERKSVTVPKDKLRWSFGAQPRTVPYLKLTTTDPVPTPITELRISTAIVESGGPDLRISGSFPGARFEALLFTELGYSIGLFGGPNEHAPMQAPDQNAGADPGDGTQALVGSRIPEPFGGTISLLDLLKLQPGGEGSGGPALWEAIVQAADFGATEAYLELRAIDGAKGTTNRPVGASSWIHLTWDPELRDELLPMDIF